jgi:DNA-binding MarR family transcriptional regulator
MLAGEELFRIISLRHALVLRYVAERYSQNEIAHKTHFHRSTIKRLVRELEVISGTGTMGELARW